MDSNIMRLMADKQEANEEMALITVISSNLMQAGRPGTMMLVDQYGLVVAGDIGNSLLQEMARQEAEKCLSKGLSRKVVLSAEDSSVEIFINVFCNKDRLIIVGSAGW